MFSFRSLPLEGAAERSEAGLAFFLGGEAASSLPFPRGKGCVSGIAVFSYRSLPLWERGDRVSGARVLSYNGALETISLALSYRHCPIRLASLATFPSRGRLCPSLFFFSTYPVFALTMREKRHPRIAAFPIGKGDRVAALGCSR